MPVQAFSFPVPETRFFQAGRCVFKFKITCGGNYSGEDMAYDDFVNEELEDTIRITLANLDALQPFATKHFIVFPYKCKWERVSKLRFALDGAKLSLYPYLITLYVEPRLQSHENTVDKQTEEWCIAETGSLQESAPCPSSPGRPRKRSKREQPQECALPQPSMDAHNQQQCDEDSPEQVDEAEEIVYDSKANAEGSEENMQEEALTEELLYEENDDAEEEEQESPEEGKPSILTRIARATFPFSAVSCNLETQHRVVMSSCVTPCVLLLVVPLLALLLLSPISHSYEVLSPGCHLYPFNVTIRSDRKGTCRGTHVVYACVGYCESSAFPSRYSVLLASNFTHNITSASRCCTISRDTKVKVRLDCPRGRRHDDIEILTAQACRCDMCRKSRY
ncbi:glycoprotein hormone alpha-2 [Engraulis encrasicolus]|uniref:glycoprotein hormone alpha-2 n=1 Tax=Engraulis encrasicolus TaxID=184585 RepID=UPI002FD168F3